MISFLLYNLYPTVTNISTKTNMPPRSTRARKQANHLLKSLAALPIDPEPVPEPVPDPELLIDLQLLDTDNLFLDSYIENTQPQSPSYFNISQLSSANIQGH